MSPFAEVEAPAKVNLILRVLGRRPDGYHQLHTLFQAVDLTDSVSLERGGQGVELSVRGADLGPATQNLAHRAASRLLSAAGIGGGVRIELTKRIPAGAGLGGGSSDAAAVLKGIAALAGVPPEDARLLRIGAELGSDIPFFLGSSPLAIGRGRGDELDPLRPLPEGYLVLVSPPVHVSTAWAYRALDGARQGAPPGADTSRGGPDAWHDVIDHAHNDFQEVVAAAHPEVARSLAALTASGAEAALLSGSGSTSFGIFLGSDAAEHAADRLAGKLGWPCRAVRTLSALPAPRLCR